MSAAVTAWKFLADRNPLIGLVDACLRGTAQVLLQNNPVTGLLILGAIAWGAVENGAPRIFGGAVVGVVVGTLTAVALRVDGKSLRQGLFGFNPLLTGIGVTTFLGSQPLMWLYLVLGAVATTVVTLALNAVFKRLGLTAFTFPFVLTTWVLLLGAYQFTQLTVRTGLRPMLPGTGAVRAAGFNWHLIPEFLRGVSEVYLINSWISGLVIVAALLVNSRWSALYALVGSVGATLFAVWFGAGAPDLAQGLFGFNAVLTAVAIGAVLHHPGVLVTLYTLFGVALTLFVQVAMATALAPLAIPVLTAPFNIATWLLLLPRPRFAPVPNHERTVHTLVSARTRRG